MFDDSHRSDIMAKKNTADVVFLVGLLVVLAGLFVYVNTLPPEPEDPEEGDEGAGDTVIETGSVVSIDDCAVPLGLPTGCYEAFNLVSSNAGSDGGTA